MSYAITKSLFPDNTSDASFRAWGSFISNAISSMGLVASSDTGQINWSTVTTPGAGVTSQGYEIWKFNDTLQSTVPVFIKIEYGSGNSSALNPGLWVTIGSGSNGTGTLTGQLSSRIVESCSSTSSTTTYNCVFSGDVNRLGIALFNYLPSSSLAFFIERTKNTDGTDSSLGVLFSGYNPSVNQMLFVPASGSVGTLISNSNISGPAGISSGAGYSNELTVYSAPVSRGGAYLNSGTTHIGYFSSDIGPDITFTISLYGSSKTFYPLGNYGAFGAISRNGASSMSLAMRYQ